MSASITTHHNHGLPQQARAVASAPRKVSSANTAVERRAAAASLFARMHGLSDDDPRRAVLRDALVALHQPLVRYLARRYVGHGEPLEDLMQVATIGLLNAIDRFDPARALAFSTYATPTIIGVIKHHLRDTGWLLHVPRPAQELQPAIAAARATLTQALGRAPTVPELALRVGTSEHAVVEALDIARSRTGVTFEQLMEGNASAKALRLLETGFEQVENRAVLRRMLAALPDVEREVLILRYMQCKTQKEIGRLTNRSQMQVCRLLARALLHLRDGLDVPSRSHIEDAG